LGEVGGSVDLNILANVEGTLGKDFSSLVDSSLNLSLVRAEDVSSSAFNSAGSTSKDSFTLGDVRLDCVPVGNVVLNPHFPFSLSP